MKNLSLSVKYSFYFLTTFLFLFLLVYFFSFDNILFSIIFSLIYFLTSIIFLKFEIINKLRKKTEIINNISDLDGISEDNNYESKISKLEEIFTKLKNDGQYFASNAELRNLYESVLKINKEIINELNTAKIFKINRNEFLGNVAHELRTPIFAIQLSLETLIDGALNDEKVNKDFLNRALIQSNRLKELVDDLINISRLEAGMKMSKRYFNINDFIREVINELSGLVAKKNITIEFNVQAGEKTQVFADEERIKQVMINLIDNATKYMVPGGLIKIFTREEEKEVFISVSDSGVGIPEKDLPRIFERFYRVDKNRSREIGGSGLGLSIVKHILELHNSQIKVESEVNKGTKFEFNLPK